MGFRFIMGVVFVWIRRVVGVVFVWIRFIMHACTLLRRGVRISRFAAYIKYTLMHEYATYKVITFVILSIHILCARM